jgi:hypothetical protein
LQQIGLKIDLYEEGLRKGCPTPLNAFLTGVHLVVWECQTIYVDQNTKIFFCPSAIEIGFMKK